MEDKKTPVSSAESVPKNQFRLGDGELWIYDPAGVPIGKVRSDYAELIVRLLNRNEAEAKR